MKFNDNMPLPWQVQPPRRHGRRVHEDDVDAGDVQRHTGREHDAGLRLERDKH